MLDVLLKHEKVRLFSRGISTSEMEPEMGSGYMLHLMVSLQETQCLFFCMSNTFLCKVLDGRDLEFM